MESYNQMGPEDSSHRRGSFPAWPPVPYLTSSLIAPLNMNMSQSMHLQSALAIQSAAGKNKGPRFPNYPLTVEEQQQQQQQEQQQEQQQRDQMNNSTTNNINDSSQVEAMKAKIIAHPQYSNLLQAYLDCQKVGAPPEVATRISDLREECEKRQPAGRNSASNSKDPELDQFMEAYYDMLVKYREELARPIQEAMEFMAAIKSQLNLVSNGHSRLYFTSDDRSDQGIGSSSEEDEENSAGGETLAELPEIDPRAEDRKLKNHLLKKYGGYLGSLKQELSKKKKKGKLPKEARHKLLTWWELHYKWPYPSESEKMALAETTGLDEKQINNWFINQRKRHWKPSEDMQMMVMEGIHSYPYPHKAALYMESNYMDAGVDTPFRFGT